MVNVVALWIGIQFSQISNFAEFRERFALVACRPRLVSCCGVGRFAD